VAQVVWSEQALDQLEDACRFIARGSPRYAAIFAQRAIRAVAQLEQFPQSGRIVPELGNRSIREVVVQSYRIMYRVAGDRVQILFVYHGARRPREFDQIDQ
jgi:toxin ParE1/3/4